MTFAVVPVLYGPLQVLLALLPALLMMLGGAFIALFKPSTFKKSVRLFWRLKIPLLVGAAGVYGCVWAVREFWPRAAAAKAEVAAADWPQFRGGPQRLGALPGSPPPLAGGVNWSFADDLNSFYASPAVIGNRIYCIGYTYGPLNQAGNSAIYCLDADTGALVWRAVPDKYRATFSSPSVSGKYMVVGEGLHKTPDARVFCLDLEQQGKVLWSHSTANHVESSACIADGRVCIGAGDDGYYCFALEPVPQGKSQLLWHAPHVRCPDAECSPTYHDGKFYVGLGLRGDALVCLDAKTGEESWRIAATYPVFAPPAISNGKLLIGMGNGNFPETADQAAKKELDKLKAEGATEAQLTAAAEHLKPGGEVWCIDLNSPKHDVLWKFKTGDIVLGAIAIADDGKIYFGARSGIFFALSPDGAELARWDMRAPILASPSVLGDYVYVINENGKLIAFNRHTLKPEWSTSIGGKTGVLSSPAVARGHVYVGSIEEGLRCLGAPAVEVKTKPAWRGAFGGPGKPGHTGSAELPERGALLWRWPADSTDGAAPEIPKISAPVAVLDDLLCVPIAGGAQRGLVALANDSSKDAPAQRWHFPTPNGVSISPAIIPPPNDDKKPAAVFVVDGKRGDANRQLNCLDAANGSVRWHVPVSADASGEFSVLGERILLSSSAQDLACFALDGKPLWKKVLGTLSGPASHQYDVAVVALSNPPKLVALDLPTGGELWSVNVPTVTGPVVDNGTIFVGTSSGVAAFRLLDGSAIWSAPSAAPAQPLMLLNGRIVALATNGELLLIDSKTGAVAEKTADTNAAFAPLLTDDAVYFFSGKESIMRKPIGQTQAQRWMTAVRLGAYTSPPAASGDCIFFATERRGLLKVGKSK